MRTETYRLWAYPCKSSLSRGLIRRGHWVPDVTEAFLANLRPGAFVVDAGANFGHFSLTAASVIGPEGLILAFEPDAQAFAELTANAALESRAPIHCVNAGLGERQERLALTHDAANPGGHSFVPGAVRADGGARMVETFALDEWLAEAGLINRRLHLLKIDAEGFEGRVIKGAENTISRDRPVVLCEISSTKMRAAGDSHCDLISFFVARRYVLNPIVGGAPREMGPEALIELLEDGRVCADVLMAPL